MGDNAARIESVRDALGDVLRHFPPRPVDIDAAGAAMRDLDEIMDADDVPGHWIERLVMNVSSAITASTVDPEAFRGGLTLVRHELALIRDRVKKGVYR